MRNSAGRSKPRVASSRCAEFTQQEEFEYHKLLNMDLPVSALYLLAAPSTPDEARDEIAQRVEAGEKISCQTVKNTIARSRYLHRVHRSVAQSKPPVSPTTHGAIDDAAKKQPATALNLLELWDRTPSPSAAALSTAWASMASSPPSPKLDTDGRGVGRGAATTTGIAVNVDLRQLKLGDLDVAEFFVARSRLPRLRVRRRHRHRSCRKAILTSRWTRHDPPAFTK